MKKCIKHFCTHSMKWKTPLYIATLAITTVFMTACVGLTSGVNTGAGPELQVEIPELFSPDPDIVNDTMSIGITVVHLARISNWHIEIQPVRRQAGQGPGEARTGGERQAGERQDSERRRRPPFYEQSGTGRPPSQWQWNGRGTSGEMVQSVTDYSFRLVVNDVFDNSSTYEGVISVGVIVRREGDNYRIVVPAIAFPPDSSDFRLLSPEEIRSNQRVLGLIARALDRFDDFYITIEGHANPTTPPNTAQRITEEAGAPGLIGLRPLSEQRARVVMDYLIDNGGISRDRLDVIGVGGTRTVADWDDDEENWKNRRVEFIMHG